MYEIFNKAIPKTDLQKKISKIFNSDLLCLKNNYTLENQEIIFTKNYNKVSHLKYKHAPRSNSLQRKLLNSLLFDLKPLLDNKKKIIDVGGGSKSYGKFLGFSDDNIKCLDISPGKEVDYKENAEEYCISVPRGEFDYALNINYLLLSEKPENVIKNTSSFLKPGGLAIIDFLFLGYWYLGNDGMHYMLYTPSKIKKLIEPYFSDFIVIPVGNYIFALFNYYSKMFKSRLFCKFLQAMGIVLGNVDCNPLSAINYLVLAKK